MVEVRGGGSALDDDKHFLFVIGGINSCHGYQSDVKMLDLKSVDYSIESGTSINSPKAYCGVVAI